MRTITRSTSTIRDTNTSNAPHRNGQAIVFVLMALTILVFAFLWNVDLHRIITGKDTAQNAGDSAALAAAKWQGATLNLVGQLNIIHALALSAGDTNAVDAVTNAQARLCYTGPLTALVAAQVAAKNNKIYQDSDFTRIIAEHADDVSRYNDSIGGGLLFPEPYFGAWQDYSGMLRSVANDGIAAAPDNTSFYGDITSGHILLDRGFYDAVAGQDWCWFYLNYATSDDPPQTILDSFVNYDSFGPLPLPDPPSFENSEIFGLGLTVRSISLERVGGINRAIETASDSAGIDVSGLIQTNYLPAAENWYFFSPTKWISPWPGMDPDGADPLPLAGTVKPEYNYTGADAVIRLYATTYSLSDSTVDDSGKPIGRDIVWTAAAKPFGYLEDTDSQSRTRPEIYGLVLPAFHDTRLIPMDAASSGGDGTFDIGWRKHTDEHLPVYTETGHLHDGCRYCSLIKRFENATFRARGSAWLLENHNLCTLPSRGGGGGRGGGTRRGH